VVLSTSKATTIRYLKGYRNMENKTVEITINEINPYHKCPECGNANITTAFQICIDCKVWIKWVKNRAEEKRCPLARN
jgi:predicted RNA-binding Zn-ribbon protein involved in translation (DUF1610 family)